MFVTAFRTTTTRHTRAIARNVSYFQLFPKTFPQPQFTLEDRSLRKEYRALQKQQHPDLTQEDTQSSLLNRAYTILKSPLTRAQHLLQLQGIDLMDENNTTKYSDPELLFEVMNVHEQLEDVQDDRHLAAIKEENDIRLEESVNALNTLFEHGDFEQAAKETVKLKYWVNVDNVVKNWDGSTTLIH